MSNPLSPLTTSRQNTRALSSDFGDATGKRESIDRRLPTDFENENPLLSPKNVIDNRSNPLRQSFGYEDVGYDAELPETDNEEEGSFHDLQSSPFRPEGRDDTVDMQMMRKYQASLGLREHSATPRKRSYDQAPDVHELEVEESDRSKRNVPNINVYADDDSEYYQEERGLGDATEQDVEPSLVEDRRHEGMSTVLRGNNQGDSFEDKEELEANEGDDAMDDDDSHDVMDDTCFSTFSAVPNVDMTAFANLRGGSPFKSPRPLPDFPVNEDNTTPLTAQRSPRKHILLDMSSPIGSPTPRKRDLRDTQESSGTPNLLDLTDQTGLFPRRQRYSVQPHERYSPSRRSPLRNPRESIRTPAKISLLDFDIPAAPTPRSIPTVTPRELESLKSGFLSEISSLRATLSGKEAEVSSLKQAVADAERRVGEALEEVRNVAARKEALEIEQTEWQRRGREMEEVLRSVKADIVEGERERECMQKNMEESEKGKAELESRVLELETQLTAARNSATCEHGTSDGTASSAKTAEETAREVQEAVQKVAHDLHGLYKTKHETKVAALKKSYEARWEKRLREAENKLKAATEESERFKAERDAALHDSAARLDSSCEQLPDVLEAEKRVLEAQIKGLQQEMASLKGDSEQLRAELKAERAEKGDLVALVEEWLSMQIQQPPAAPPFQPRDDRVTPEPVSHNEAQQQRPQSEEPEQDATRGSSGSGGLRRGLSTSSSSSSNNGDRKIPRIGALGSRHGRGNSGGKSGIAVFTPGKSGIMGSIERMGRGAV
ncbi:hypothetical protein BJY01DRAFT_229030 [Aspergillus pseudoustus]|uniref:Central kinetochore-associated-domain-containing protein n=1 Tax=Aspergillus pseudoustus TaxID=1810923 RepID=A0ABR4IIQ1_9EURO